MTHQQLNEQLPSVIEGLVASLGGEPGLAHLNRVYLPSKETIIESIKRLRQLVFPGYFGEQGLTPSNISYRIGELVLEVSEMLYQQVRCCLRYSQQIPGANGNGENCKECDTKAAEIVHTFLKRITDVRQMLASDVAAAFEGDPAAQSADETIFCYPGLFAITVQRLAHEFHKLAVPLLPRIMTEHAHSETGIDIHPGAKLGKSFFIDHGTGVVIGETSEIGNNVKVYQGVTLGALAPAVPDRVIAATNGANTAALFDGKNTDGSPWIYLETIGGGSGARPGSHSAGSETTFRAGSTTRSGRAARAPS